MSESPADALARRTPGRGLVLIALPLALSAGVRYAVELSTAYWIGKLGVASLSIATALGTFMSLAYMFAGLTSAGTSAVIGRALGEGRRRDASRIAQKVTAVALVLGAAVAVIALVASKAALDALALSGDLRVEASRYLHVLLLGLPLSFGMMAMTGVLVGLGRPRASMIASTVSFGVTFVTTPLLLRSAGTGVWGAGLAQIAGEAAGYLVGLRALRAHAGATGSMPWRERVADVRELWPVFRVGAPLTADAVAHGAVWFVLIAFLSRYGGEYVAAQGAEERLSQVLNIPTDGLAPAAATLVGYNLGRGRRHEALRVVRLALGVVVTLAVGGALVLRLAPGPVVAWICSEPAFVEVGAEILAIASVGLVFLGARSVLEATFGAMGDTTPPVVVGLVITLARIPLAYVFAVKLGHGGLGVAWAVNSTLALQTLALGALFVVRFDRARPHAPPPRDASAAAGPTSAART
ncbi:MAG: MATE family efflux transporter [Labilithrix sp.]|nr:MATE family efflux transporter [Labilithrix sp.]